MYTFIASKNNIFTVDCPVCSKCAICQYVEKTKVLHKMHQRYFILMDNGHEWRSEEKLQDCQHINNEMFIIKIDWRDTSFPCEVLDDSPLSEDDR